MVEITEEVERDLQECMDLIDGWNSLVHQTTRLALLVLMYHHGASNYLDLRKVTNFSKGNLSNHLGKLEEGGLVSIEKFFEKKKPVTAVFLTDEGRRQLEQYFEDHRRIQFLSRQISEGNG